MKGHNRPHLQSRLQPRTEVSHCRVDNSVKLWDFARGKEVRTLTGHTGPVYCVAFSPTAPPWLFDLDQSIALVDGRDGKLLREIKATPHLEPLLSVPTQVAGFGPRIRRLTPVEPRRRQ